MKAPMSVVAAVVAVLLLSAVSAAEGRIQQLPICDPTGTPMPVENIRATANKYNAATKTTTLTIAFDNPTKVKPTAGCVKHYEVNRVDKNGKDQGSKKVFPANPRESPLSVTFDVVPGSTSSLNIVGVTAAGKTGLRLGGSPVVAADAPAGTITARGL